MLRARSQPKQTDVTLFSTEVSNRWNQVSEYSKGCNKTACNICGKLATFDNTLANRFNYDHVDMFDKKDSICKMVREGSLIDNIYKEIDRCQLLCASCHTIVTKIEHKCGFIRLKKQLNKDYDDGEIDKKEELQKEYSAIYSKLMNDVYNIIRSLI